MRVLAVIDSLAQGGAERSLVDLLPYLRAEGAEVDIVVLVDRDGLADEARAAGAEVIALGPVRRDVAVRRLRSRLVADPPDLVHTTLFGANLVGRVAARTARVPVVSSLVNTPYGPDHFATPGISKVKLRGSQALDVVSARLVTRFHANAAHVARTMAPRLRIPPDRIDVVPRGRDPLLLGERTHERRLRVRRALGATPSDVLVLALARHEHQKGLDVLLDAVPAVLASVLHARFLIAGREGNATPDLRRRVATAGLEGSVQLLGYRDDVADLLAAADVFVLPSRREGFPGVIVEAMALRAPIVATDLPGTREALGEGNGTLVPVDDAERLAAAIVGATTTTDELAAQVDRAHGRFVEHFTTAAVAHDMVQFYERALATRLPTGRG